MSGPSLISSKLPECHAINPRLLAGRRVSRYLSEPPTFGNTLVGLPNGTTDIAAAQAAHRARIAAELASLEDQLPSRT